MCSSDADRLLTAWLTSVAPTREPEHLLGAVLEQTARTPRRRAWRIPQRWIPMATVTTRVAPGGRVPWSVIAVGALVALALVAGLMLLAGSRTRHVPAPFGPAANGELVYETNGNLFSVDLSTGKTAGITSAAGLEVEPQFSRDGTQLAWLSAADVADLDPHIWSLRVAQPTGAGARDIGTFSDVDWFAWSPDGQRIAISSTVGDKLSLSMVDVATGTSNVLATDLEATEPAFRPGGLQLVFRGRASDGFWGLYIVDVDGGHLLRLGLDPGFADDANFALNRDSYFFNPVWSPDGTRLAFHTLEESTVGEDPGFRVHLATIDSTGLVTAETTLPTDAEIDDEFQPAWLPDGGGLVAHRVEESVHSLVRWPVDDQLGIGAPAVLSLGRLVADPTDLRFAMAPDGTQVLAWKPGERAQLVPINGGSLRDTGLVIADGADWQRTAP
jgi:hypothetical protein